MSSGIQEESVCAAIHGDELDHDIPGNHNTAGSTPSRKNKMATLIYKINIKDLFSICNVTNM